MNRKLLFGIMVFLFVIGISLVGDQPQAQAGHGYHYAYNCGGCYGGWHGGYVGHGWHHWGYRHHYRPHYVGYGCYGYPCAGYVGCGCYGHTSCYAGCGCYGYSACGGVVMGDAVIVDKAGPAMPPVDPEPATPDVAAPPELDTTPTPPPPPAPDTAGEADSAKLNVRVPQDAKIVINDYETSSKGVERSYVSRGLQEGLDYEFEVRAEVIRDGRTLTKSKLVRLQANGTADIAFDFDSPQVASLER
jgi:uncharacterized protein (TIGR03000 family)